MRRTQLWQGVEPGLNAVVSCKNNDCRASEEPWAICSLGFGEVDVGMDLPDLLLCPLCERLCEGADGGDVKLLCSGCVWSIEGRLASGGARQRSRGQVAELGVPLRQANETKWRALRLRIEHIPPPVSNGESELPSEQSHAETAGEPEPEGSAPAQQQEHVEQHEARHPALERPGEQEERRRHLAARTI